MVVYIVIKKSKANIVDKDTNINRDSNIAITQLISR